VGGTVKTPLAAGLDIDFGTVEMIRRAERPLAGWPGNKVVSCTLSWQPRASLSLLGQWAGSSFDDGSLPELDFLTGKARYVELAIGDENRKLKVENWRVDPDFISIGAQSPSQTLLTVQDPLDALTIQGNPLEEADLELAPFGIASANRMGSRLTVQLPLGNNTIAFMLSRGAQIRPSYEELDQSGAIQSIPQQLIHYGERKTRFTLDVSKVIKGATLELALGSVRTSRDDDANTTVSELIKKDQAVFEVGLNVNRLAVGFRQVKAEGCNEQFGLLKFKQNVAADYAMEWKYQLARRVRSPQTEFFGQLGTCSLNIDF
jgi:hypothetical protein